MRQLGRALTQQPALASLSVETNLRPKLQWLRELRIPRLANQLDAYPAVLTLSLDANLRPTAAALRRASLLGDTKGGDTDGSTTKPTKLRLRHLAASLESRILPRVGFGAALHG